MHTMNRPSEYSSYPDADPDDSFEVISTVYAVDLQERMNAARAEGFELVAFAIDGRRLVAVMERTARPASIQEDQRRVLAKGIAEESELNPALKNLAKVLGRPI